MIKMLDYIRYIRECLCIVCDAPAEPHHLKRVGMGRDRKKKLREHLSAISLCHEHHMQLHNIGEMKFTNKYRIDLWRCSHRLLISFLEQSNMLE
jgi:hypothetical protein